MMYLERLKKEIWAFLPIFIGIFTIIPAVKAQPDCGAGNFIVVEGKCVPLDRLGGSNKPALSPPPRQNNGYSRNRSRDQPGTRNRYEIESIFVNKAATIACYGNDESTIAADRGLDSARKEAPNYLNPEELYYVESQSTYLRGLVINRMRGDCPSKFKKKTATQDPFSRNRRNRVPRNRSSPSYRDPFNGSNSGYRTPIYSKLLKNRCLDYGIN